MILLYLEKAITAKSKNETGNYIILESIVIVWGFIVLDDPRPFINSILDVKGKLSNP